MKQRGMSTPHKRKQIMVDRQTLTSTYNDSGINFMYNNDDDCKSTIHGLDLAQGLIELLVENNFTLKSLLNASSSALSIDQEVATLIRKAAANGKK